MGKDNLLMPIYLNKLFMVNNEPSDSKEDNKFLDGYINNETITLIIDYPNGVKLAT